MVHCKIDHHIVTRTSSQTMANLYNILSYLAGEREKESESESESERYGDSRPWLDTMVVIKLDAN